ncbi:MAG: DegT/DnrJ/EryC1/StrS family aminotransferase, partial [Candidatus Omnitrophica bacterium]|nr:DegT/DnrJ/EryC1/StrS family aminotransferase [Candidatus Omnitrophota bacterium]
IFSLNYHKTIQTGEGGVAITNDEKLALKLQLIRNHGEAVVDDIPDLNCETNVLGWNYRLPEIEAAIGFTQLKRLEELTLYKIKLANHLTDKLRNFKGITTPKVLEYARHVYYLYTMKFDEEKIGISRDLFVKAVRAEGVSLTAGYMHPLYLQSIYQRKKVYGDKNCPFSCAYYSRNVEYKKGLCPVTERLEEKEVMTTNICRIPLTFKEIDIFVLAIEKVFENLDKLKEYANKT